MKKITIKGFAYVSALAFSLCFFAFSFVGCSKGGAEVDETKTQLYIGNFDGGVGSAWFDEVKRLFEIKFADAVFEDGKRGVQVWIDRHKDNFAGEVLFSRIESARQDVIFTNEINYPDFATKHRSADITDIVTEKSEKITDDLGNEVLVSIEDKMNKSLADYYKWDDGKYYAIPFIDALYGIVYDAELFEDYGFYDDGPGPDGIRGTIDDGLPQTWEDFKKLILLMVNSGITPFTWSGLYQYYREAFMNSIHAGYEGFNDYLLNYTFSGTDDLLGEITPQTGWKLQQQNGRLAALKVAEFIFSSPNNYSSKAMGSSQSHIAAQEEFLISATTSNRIAMLIEGGWWENEARDTFNEMGRKNSAYSYGNRKLGFMPFPKFIGGSDISDQKQTEGLTLFSSHGRTVVCVKPNTTKMEAAKEFVKFTTSNEILAHLTVQTGVTRPYAYNLTQGQKDKMTPFGRMMWEIVSHEKTSVAYNMKFHSGMYENSSYFENWPWVAKIGNDTDADVFRTFYNNRNMTAQTYLQGMQAACSESNWILG